MNPYLKAFLYYGLPTAFLMSLILGLFMQEPLGFAIGAVMGVLFSVAITLIGGAALSYAKPVSVTDWFKKLRFQDILMPAIMLTPYLVLIAGAYVTKTTMNLYAAFPLTIIATQLSMLALIWFIKKSKRDAAEEEGGSLFVLLVTPLPQLTITYFIILAMLFYPDMETFRGLF